MSEAAAPLLGLCGVTRSYPGVRALDAVDFALHAGEVHALLGQNGAGKSTLLRIVTGAESPDAGIVLWHGCPVRLHGPAHAQRLGIGAVHQELHLVPDLSVAENLLLGSEPLGRLRRVDWAALRRGATQAMARLGISIDVRRPLRSCPLALQQLVAIARALRLEPQVLVFDEPTSSLDAPETARLLEIMRGLRRAGMGIILVTHSIDQVERIADRITVLRNGRVAAEGPLASLPRGRVLEAMLGRAPDARGELCAPGAPSAPGAPAATAPGEPVLEAIGLRRRGAVESIDLRVDRGKVVGLAGLLGSGRSECARLLAGLDRRDGGIIRLRGRRLRFHGPRRALRRGLGMVPEDRRTQGLVPHLSLRKNIALGVQARRGWLRPMRRRTQEDLARRFVRALGIDTTDLERPVRLLSGGNQQKALLARWLATDPFVLILDEPTRGIDVGAKEQVQTIVRGLRQSGMAILMIDSELEELVRASDRVIVLHERRRVAELHGPDVTAGQVIRAMANAPRGGPAEEAR